MYKLPIIDHGYVYLLIGRGIKIFWHYYVFCGSSISIDGQHVTTLVPHLLSTFTAFMVMFPIAYKSSNVHVCFVVDLSAEVSVVYCMPTVAQATMLIDIKSV